MLLGSIFTYASMALSFYCLPSFLLGSTTQKLAILNQTLELLLCWNNQTNILFRHTCDTSLLLSLSLSLSPRVMFTSAAYLALHRHAVGMRASSCCHGSVADICCHSGGVVVVGAACQISFCQCDGDAGLPHAFLLLHPQTSGFHAYRVGPRGRIACAAVSPPIV